MALPKTLVFHDSKQEVTDAATFLELNLLPSLHGLGIVRHCHSDMSIDYLQETFDNFAQPHGMCQILHATAGAAMVGTIV
ncbi:hypothetical protein J3R83DRAFT_3030 [Lanmaoa asiatica]|nr:hypothetical protein J3R83DRAFT_3030 [Lanmaoa asiatica]